jgi:large subunit ribosomal protein L9
MKPTSITKDNMELILKQDVQNLGFKDDVVTVKTDGRNLIHKDLLN